MYTTGRWISPTQIDKHPKPFFIYRILYFSILDDVEVFEKQKAFELEELMAIADFFNYLTYETVLLVPDRESSTSFLKLILLLGLASLCHWGHSSPY